ncbi:hypothetical protein ACEXQE_17650 [Herbiconiux sp. P17]|uniref:hypothetical protein n=1 Tax=Herbiconiux wuyangfengii TaxID=3342794 RepID=UPI0035BA46C0
MALESENLTIEHRGFSYELAGGPPRWAVTRDGTLFGYLIVKSPVGEEGEPVYTTLTPEGVEGYIEGTDWEQIAKAFFNEVDPAIDPPFSGSPGATQ